MPFLATWMDLVIIILSEVSQREKAKYYTILFICGIYKQNKTKQNKTKTNALTCKAEADSQTQKQTLLPKGKRGRKIGNLVYRYTPVYVR